MHVSGNLWVRIPPAPSINYGLRVISELIKHDRV